MGEIVKSSQSLSEQVCFTNFEEIGFCMTANNTYDDILAYCTDLTVLDQHHQNAAELKTKTDVYSVKWICYFTIIGMMGQFRESKRSENRVVSILKHNFILYSIVILIAISVSILVMQCCDRYCRFDKLSMGGLCNCAHYSPASDRVND